jgi:hypothetical protein
MSRAGLMAVRDPEPTAEDAAEGEQTVASRRSSKSVASRRSSKTFDLDAQAEIMRRDSKSKLEARWSQRFYDGEHDILNVDLKSTLVETAARVADDGDESAEEGTSS